MGSLTHSTRPQQQSFMMLNFNTFRTFVTISLMVIATSFSVSANDTEDENRTHLKVIGGLSYSTLSGEDGIFGPVAGAQFDIRVSSQPVYVGAGIEYMNKGFRHHSNPAFAVPFLGSYHLNVAEGMTIEPFAGTVISYGFNWKNWDCGLRLGCAVTANKWDFSVGYDLGFRHYNFGNADGRNQSLFLTAGYNFTIH